MTAVLEPPRTFYDPIEYHEQMMDRVEMRGEFEPLANPYLNQTPPPGEKRTLVIGDVHGKLHCLETLLMEQDILARCPDCDGDGDHAWDGNIMCPPCGGDGFRRINYDVKVIQLGDLGHFGIDGSPTGDEMCYRYGYKWLDEILWGNHDRAVVDPTHHFGGYFPPPGVVKHIMRQMYNDGKLKLASAAHGHLLTHAGLHAAWKQQPGIEFDRSDPYAVADWINRHDWWPEEKTFREQLEASEKELRSAQAVRDAIGSKRGGRSTYGGILWRDRTETLYDEFPQVFGHSADRNHLVRRFNRKGDFDLNGKHYCVDIGGKKRKDDPGADCLAGVWLPEMKIVRVDL